MSERAIYGVFGATRFVSRGTWRKFPLRRPIFLCCHSRYLLLLMLRFVMLDHICFTMLGCSGLSSFIICSSMPGCTTKCCVILVSIRICYILGHVRLYLVM